MQKTNIIIKKLSKEGKGIRRTFNKNNNKTTSKMNNKTKTNNNNKTKIRWNKMSISQISNLTKTNSSKRKTDYDQKQQKLSCILTFNSYLIILSNQDQFDIYLF